MNLQDNKLQIAAAIESIRKEWKGKEGQMPPDVEEKLDRALEDWDKNEAAIAREAKLNRVSEWASTPEDAPEQFKRKSGGDEPDKLMTAWTKYLIKGDREGDNYADVARKTLQIDDPSKGGYLMAPSTFLAELIKEEDRQFVALSLARTFTVKRGSTLGAPTLASRATATRSGELTESTETTLTVGKRELAPKDSKAFVKVGRKLLDNAAMDPQAIVMSELAYAFGYLKESEFISGTGVNSMLGIYTASNDGIPTSRDVDNGGTTLTGDSFWDVFFKLRPVYRPLSTWVFHPDIIKTARKLKDSSNSYIWNPGGVQGQALITGLPASICGRPYIESEFAPNTFTDNLYWACIGDFSKYWIAQDESMYVQVLRELYARTSEVGYHAESQFDGAPVLSEAFARGQF